MKKIFLIFLIIIFLVIGVIVYNHNKNKEKYEKIINDYMVDLASKQKETTCFYDVKYFGKNYEYIYAWVSEQCYYKSENKIVKESGSSKAYRFYQEYDVIKSFENPDDGDNYEKDMEELFPVIVKNKMSKYSSKHLQKSFENLDIKAKKHFNLNEFTSESSIENTTIGNISKISVQKGKLKKLLTINSRAIYGIKNGVMLYDKNNYEHELKEALDAKVFNLEQIEEYLNVESKNGNIKVEQLQDGGTFIYSGKDFTVITCHTSDDNNDLYFGDENLKYKESYCK